MFEYKCGHNNRATTVGHTNENVRDYLEWVETVGMNGTKEKCFECYCSQKNDD